MVAVTAMAHPNDTLFGYSPLDKSNPNKGFEEPPTLEQFQAFAVVMGFPTVMTTSMMAMVQQPTLPMPRGRNFPTGAPLPLPARVKAAAKELTGPSTNKRRGRPPGSTAQSNKDKAPRPRRKRVKKEDTPNESSFAGIITNAMSRNAQIMIAKNIENSFQGDKQDAGYASTEEYGGEVIQV